jgi:hypothetical protein
MRRTGRERAAAHDNQDPEVVEVSSIDDDESEDEAKLEEGIVALEGQEEGAGDQQHGGDIGGGGQGTKHTSRFLFDPDDLQAESMHSVLAKKGLRMQQRKRSKLIVMQTVGE